MGKTGPVSIALLALVALATPAWANTCALQGSFVASAALNAPGLTQALVRFEFVPPPCCEDGVPGNLIIEAGSLVIEALVAFVEPEGTLATVGLAGPATSNLNLSKSNINIFVFTASDAGNPNVGFSGMAATTVKSSKSNSDN